MLKLSLLLSLVLVPPAMAEGRVIYLETGTEAHSNSAPVIRIEDGDTIVLRPPAKDTRPFSVKHPKWMKAFKAFDWFVTRLGAAGMFVEGIRK